MKKILALGAVGLMSAGGAMAQSGVVVYGVLDTYMAYTNAEQRGNIVSMDSGGYQASRVGFRGNEDLGGGLRATWQLESGIGTDTGAQHDSSRVFNRQAWVGLGGTFGELRFGRQNSSNFLMIARLDPFAGATFGSFLNNVSVYTPRYDNVVGYISPSVNGFKLQAYYSLGERTEDSDAMSTAILAGEYEKGPMYLGVSSSRQTSANGEETTTSTFAGGSYEYGQGRIYLSGYRGNNLGAAPVTNVRGIYYSAVSLSASYRIGARTTLGAGLGWGEATDGSDSDARQVSVIAMHDLSRRTMLYAVASHLINRGQAAFSLGAAAPIPRNVPIAGGNVDGVQFGIRHNF